MQIMNNSKKNNAKQAQIKFNSRLQEWLHC